MLHANKINTVILKKESKHNQLLLRVLFFAFCWSLLSLPTVKSQKILTLKKAVENGLTRNKNIISGRVETDIRIQQTKALYRHYMPRVSAEYSYVYNPILPTSILPIGVFNPNFPPDATRNVRFGTTWSQTAGVNAEQSLLDFSIKRKIQEARVSEKISMASTKESTYQLVADILNSFVNVYILESEIREFVADSIRTFVSYELQQIRFDENRLLKADLNKAKINHNIAAQRAKDAEYRLEEEKLFLLYLTGEENPGNTDFRIDTGFFFGEAMSWVEKMPVPEKLPAIERFSLQEQLTASQISIEKSARLPSVSLKGYIGANQFYNTFSPFAAGSWFGLSFVGLSASFPILSGESLSNRIRQLQLQSEQYKLDKEQILQDAQKDILTARIQMEKTKKRLQTIEENLALAGESIQIYQERFRQGLESASVLNAEETSYQLLASEFETEKKRMWFYWFDHVKSSGLLAELFN